MPRLEGASGWIDRFPLLSSPRGGGGGRILIVVVVVVWGLVVESSFYFVQLWLDLLLPNLLLREAVAASKVHLSGDAPQVFASAECPSDFNK